MHGGEAWQGSLKAAWRDPAELCLELGLPATLADAAREASRGFPLFAPREYVARMKPADPRDPLLLQVLPVAAETESQAGFVADPVGDAEARLGPGLLQKYERRALLVTTGACAIHCRYCFRRHYPYSESPRSAADWQPAIDQLAADPTVDEVVLSGGDPLTLVDRQLAELVERLERVPHLRRLRVHSRLPIVIPSRVTSGLLRWLAGGRLTPIMVVHANHASELDVEVAGALDRLRRAGVLLLNQAVLLRGVNDDERTLVDLSLRLVDLGVTPYYLHQLDRVAGAAHFEVPVAEGQRLIARLRELLPGYAVPRYVVEQPGQPSKTPLA